MIIESETIYKLLTLYMLNKLDIQLTNVQLSSFFVDGGFIDYFRYQKALSDLCSSGFVEKVVMRNTSYYSITPEGYESLSFFKSKIPQWLLIEADRFISENKLTLKDEVATQANYYKHTNGDYICHCQIMEGHSLLYDINVSVPSDEEAERICNNWKLCSEEIYGFIMKKLLQ